MRQKFSKLWIGSKQTRKQRKYRANAPLHIKGSMISSNLSKDLRSKYKIRSIRLRKGDEVKVLRGKFKGKTGKINSVNVKTLKVTIDGIQNKKKDGSKIQVYFDSSNLQIKNLDTSDKKRFKRMSNKPEVKKPVEKKEDSKPKEETKQDNKGKEEKNAQ